MARIINKGSHSKNTRPNRENAELLIGIRNREFYNSPFTKLTNVATVKCNYYSINENESTYSEGTWNLKDSLKALRYDKIENFVIYDRPDTELEEKSDEEREIDISQTMRTSIILANTVEPKEGDHLHLLSQGRLAQPLKVTKVRPVKYIDREVYEIEYVESDLFVDVPKLEPYIIDTYEFISDNVGVAGRKSILLKNSYGVYQELLNLHKELNLNYVKSFYDEFRDTLHIARYDGGYSADYTNDIVVYLPHLTMQDKCGILKYSEDQNDLFIGRQHNVDRYEDKNFMSSYFMRFKNKRFNLYNNRKVLNHNAKGEELTNVILDLMKTRDAIFQDMIDEYVPKYDYRSPLFCDFHHNDDHLILTTLYQDKRHVFYTGPAGFRDSLSLKDPYVIYEPKDPYMLEVFDAYIDLVSNDTKGAVNVGKLLLDNFQYKVSDRYNIDDYLMLPIVIYIIQEVINTIILDNMIVTY